MKRAVFILISIMFLLLGEAQDADAILKKHLEAIGGADKLVIIHSLIKEGTIHNGYSEMVTRIVQKEHAGFKQTYTVGGMRSFTIVTPSESWQYSPALGETQVSKMAAEEKSTLRYLLFTQGILYDYLQGHTRLQQEENRILEGKEYLSVHCLDSLSNEYILILDPATYLLRGMITKQQQAEKWIETLTEYDDYREVNGVMMPFAMTTAFGWIHFNKISCNEIIDEKEFMPFKN